MRDENKGLGNLSYTLGGDGVYTRVCQRQRPRPRGASSFDHLGQGVSPRHSDNQNTWNSKYIKHNAQV